MLMMTGDVRLAKNYHIKMLTLKYISHLNYSQLNTLQLNIKIEIGKTLVD